MRTRTWLLVVVLAVALPAVAQAAATAAPEAKSKSKATATAPVKAKPRRLEDIRIEGDVPVPQVLFVTARDPRRFLDFAPERYRRSSLELARMSELPTRVVVVGTWPTVTHKESAP